MSSFRTFLSAGVVVILSAAAVQAAEVKVLIAGALQNAIRP